MTCDDWVWKLRVFVRAADVGILADCFMILGARRQETTWLLWMKRQQ